MINSEKCDQILVLMRRITRAIDLHSKQLVKKYGLTGPQLLLLKIIIAQQSISSSQLADTANLSHPTVTSILDRLAEKNYISRNKTATDKRKVMITATKAAEELYAQPPSLLQEQFVERFDQLHEWEQYQLLSSLSKIAEMMSAKDLDAAPFLTAKADIKE